MKIITKKIHRGLRGFTLLETFVAITILALALAGALSLAAEGFESASVAGDEITASFLAQDAIEYVRFARDSACLQNAGGSSDCSTSNASWLSSLTACESANGCYFDTTQNLTVDVNPLVCPANGCPTMEYDSTSGFYNYTQVSGVGTSIPNISVASATNAPSKFIRTVTIKTPVGAGSLSNSGEAAVSVTISWQDGKAPHSFTLLEDLFNWQP